MASIVTLLFVDQVSSTAQLSRLGDVHAQPIREAMFDALREAAATYGGREVDFTGDGLFVSFDGATQGADAAIEMQQLVGALNRRRTSDIEHAAIRIGIHIGEPLANGSGYFGQAVVVARRLCDRADAGQIFVSYVVQSLVAPRGTHVFSRLGDLELKGIAEPVSSFSLEYTLDEGISRLPAELADPQPSFVGRRTLLDDFEYRWRRATDGRRSAVVVDGDIGVGKTRVAAAFAAHVHDAGGMVWYGRSEPHARLSAWASALESFAGNVPRAELRLGLGRHADDVARIAPRVAERLSSSAPSVGSDAEADDSAVDALCAVVTRIASDVPLLVVLDDLQDADPLTVAVIRQLLAADTSLHLMILGLQRTRADGDTEVDELVAHAAVGHHVLGGFDLLEVTELIQKVTGQLPDTSIARSLLSDSAGNPAILTGMARLEAERLVERRVADAVNRAATVRDDLRRARNELSSSLLQLDELRVDELSRAAAGVVDAEGTPPEAMDCPYQGLAAFQRGDADWFFGREPIVASIVAKLASSSLIGVIGASGSGKSSIVRAGVLPALAGDSLPGSSSWLSVVVNPGSDPLAALAAQLCSVESILPQSDMVARLHSGGLAAVGEELIASRPGLTRLLVVIDQFEEIFTTAADDVAVEFMDLLVTAAESAHISVVIVLRADFYGHCSAHPGFASELQDSQILVGPMSRSELHRAITAPARVVGLVLEPGVVDAIMYDADDEPGLLPLVSTALLETFQRRRGRSLTLTAYAEAGGVRGAIARLADDVYAAVDDDGRAEIRRVLLRLASPGDETGDVRRRVLLSEIVDSELAKATVATLATRRLVTIDGQYVEVAHEALFREWPRLKVWLADDRNGRRLRHQIATEAADWERAGHDESLLLRGTRMAAALDYSVSDRADLNPAERRFIDASRRHAEEELLAARRTSQRLRGLLISVVLVLVAALAAGAFAFVQRGRADEAASVAEARSTAARARDLASRSEASRDPYLKLLLALESELATETPSSASRSAWAGASALMADQPALLDQPPTPTEGGSVTSIAWNHDSTSLAVANSDGTVNLVAADGSSGKTLVGPGLIAGSSAVGWNGPGDRLAVATPDGVLQIFDSSGVAVSAAAQSPPHAGSIDRDPPKIFWSPTGEVVAIAQSPGLTFADKSGRLLNVHEDVACRDAEWNPSGTQLVVVCNRGLNLFGASGDRVELGAALASLGGQTLAAKWNPTNGNLGVYNTEQGLLFVEPDGAVLWQNSDLAAANVFFSRLAEELQWSADGRMVASLRFDPLDPNTNQLRILDGATGSAGAADEQSASSALMAWSPTRHLLATGSPDGIVAIADRDAEDEALLGSVDIGQGIPLELSWDTSGTLVAAVGADGTVALVSASGEKLGQELSFEAGVTSARWSPSGTVLALGDREGTVRLLRPRSIAAETVRTIEFGWVPEWSQDSRLIADSDGHGEVVLVTAEGEEVASFRESALLYSSSRSWNRDGSRLVVFAIDGDGALMDGSVVSNDGETLFQMPNHSPTYADRITYLEWAHRSDDLLVVTGHSMSIYDRDGVVTTGPVEIGPPVFPIESAPGLADQRYARRDQWNVDDSVVAFLVDDESSSTGSDLSVLILRAGDDHVTPIDLGKFEPKVMDWSRTTDMLAVGGLDGSLRFITELGSVVSDPIPGGNAPITYMQWSTKDRLLTRDSAGVMRIYSAGGEKIAEVNTQRNCSDPMWSSSGDAFVTSCNTSSISFYDGAANVIGTFSSDVESNSPIWSPNGSMIALADTQGRVQLVATDGALINAETVFQAAGETGLPRVVWAPNGEVLAGAHATGGILMYGWSENDACQFLRRFFDSAAMNAMLGSGEVSTCGSDVELKSLPLVPVMKRRPDRS